MAPFPPCRAAVRHGPRFARPGVDIALIARGREALEGARREVASRGARAMTISIDVADHDAVETAADAVEDAFGPIDIRVNDAMVTVFAFFRDIAPAEYRRATEVTYLGTVWGTRRGARPDGAARPRHDRPRRIGDGLPRHPAAGPVLRREARHQGDVRVDPLRAAPRQLWATKHRAAIGAAAAATAAATGGAVATRMLNGRQ